MIDQLLRNPFFLTGLIILALLLAVFIIGVVSYGLNARNRILRPIVITCLFLVVYRLLWNIPLPGISIDVTSLGRDLKAVGFISEFIAVLSGGSFISGSVLSLGLFPYLAAQMAVNAIAFSGDLPLRFRADPYGGREFMVRWTMYLIIPFGILETILLLFLTTPMCTKNIFQVFYNNDSLDLIFATRTFLTLIAGSLFAVWISEMIDKYGIKGQGVNLMIFAGVSVEIVREFANIQSMEINRWISIVIYGIVTIIGILLLIFLVQARRDVRVMYGGRRIGNRKSMPVRSSLPLMVSPTSDGLVGTNLLLVLSFIYLPLLTCVQTEWTQQIVLWFTSLVNYNFHLFGPIAFTLVFLFTFIYGEMQFMASYYAPSLTASGGQIPGVHSGSATHYYLRGIQRSILLANALGLALVSILPWAFMYLTQSNVSLLDAQRWLIAIIVIHETYNSIDAERSLHGPDKYALVR